MGGDDSSEIPEDNGSSAEDRPAGGALGWFKPSDTPKEPLAEPDPHYNPDGVDQSPAADQETRFRAAAIKCSEMEDELSSLMRNKLGGGKSVGLKRDVYINRYSRMMQLTSYVEPFPGIENGQLRGRVHIDFTDFGNGGLADHAKELGINTPRILTLGIHADLATQDAYTQAIHLNPMLNNTGSMFFFTPKGEYKKFIRTDRRIPIDFQKKSYKSNEHYNFFESEMTAEDFELAGQTLSLLKKRVENPNWDAEDNPTAPLTE